MKKIMINQKNENSNKETINGGFTMNLVRNSVLTLALLASAASVVAMEQTSMRDIITNDFKQIESKQALSNSRSINRSNNTLAAMTNIGQSAVAPAIQKAVDEYKAARAAYEQALKAAPGKGRTVPAEIFNAVQTQYHALINALSSTATSTSRITTTTTAPRTTPTRITSTPATQPVPAQQQPVSTPVTPTSTAIPTTRTTSTTTSSDTVEQDVIESVPATPKKRLAKRANRSQQPTNSEEDEKRKKQIADDEAFARQLEKESAYVEEEREEEEAPSTTTTESNLLEDAFTVIQAATESPDMIVATAIQQNSIDLVKYCVEVKKQDNHPQLINALRQAHTNNNNEMSNYIKTALIEKQYGTSEKICQVCMDDENKITPQSAYVSPACGHSLCKTCTQHLVNTPVGYNQTIKCPICRDEHFADAFRGTPRPIEHSNSTSILTPMPQTTPQRQSSTPQRIILDASHYGNLEMIGYAIIQHLMHNPSTIIVNGLPRCQQFSITELPNHQFLINIKYSSSHSYEVTFTLGCDFRTGEIIRQGLRVPHDPRPDIAQSILKNTICKLLSSNTNIEIDQFVTINRNMSTYSSPMQNIIFTQNGTGNQTIVTPITPTQQAAFNTSMQQLGQTMNNLNGLFRQ